jgi:uncharacterized protein (DUF2336 family)
VQPFDHLLLTFGGEVRLVLDLGQVVESALAQKKSVERHYWDIIDECRAQACMHALVEKTRRPLHMQRHRRWREIFDKKVADLKLDVKLEDAPKHIHVQAVRAGPGG